MKGRDWVMTEEQEKAAAELYVAIDQVTQQGVKVPCQDPAIWGDGENPAACYGCPVRAGACLRFARTGAVTSGALAGMKMSAAQVTAVAGWIDSLHAA